MPPKIVLMISSMSSDMEQKSNIERSLQLIKARKMRFETVDGADPVNRERRNALFAVSGVRGKYPQWFTESDDGVASFVGMWEDVETMNERSGVPASYGDGVLTWEEAFGACEESAP
mmetsp:Transcript_13558/g.27014  ORF Transcript_13558/g.27014 Transcript_13558/m.27014 type:complete len:117 (+) Transcript_13558:105-455(+)